MIWGVAYVAVEGHIIGETAVQEASRRYTRYHRIFLFLILFSCAYVYYIAIFRHHLR
jgi:hypothetical protein